MDTGKPKKFFTLAKTAAVFVLQSLNYLLWPAVCLNCGNKISEIENHLCRDCFSQLLSCIGNDYCPHCGLEASRYALVQNRCPDCLDKQFFFDRIVRAGIYSQCLRKMIPDFKFKAKTKLDNHFALLLNSSLIASEFYNDIDFFTPVPLHWTRRLARGYNQSLILAKGIEHPSAKINTDLVRIRRTKSQLSVVTTARREKNVENAFAVRLGHKFEGKNICLVDDIKTSGATLNECAKTLKNAGANKVFALVLAVAGQKTT